MKCSICGKYNTNKRSHPHNLIKQHGGGNIQPIKVSVTLDLNVSSPEDTGNMGYMRDSTSVTRMLKKYPKDAESIIRDSLFDSKITDLVIDADKRTATFMAEAPKGTKNVLDYIQDIMDTYGDGAADTWMEGDIRFPQSSNSTKLGELMLELVHVN